MKIALVFIIMVSAVHLTRDFQLSDDINSRPIYGADTEKLLNTFNNTDDHLSPDADIEEYPEPGADKCDCALFPNESADDDEEPLFVHTASTVSCDDAGDEACLRLCSALGKAGHGRQLICLSGREDDGGVKPSVYSRVCGSPWTYTGLTSGKRICCENQKVIECQYHSEDQF